MTADLPTQVRFRSRRLLKRIQGELPGSQNEILTAGLLALTRCPIEEQLILIREAKHMVDGNRVKPKRKPA